MSRVFYLWKAFESASHSKSIAMTNKEILQADLLDILFEHRNKLYGAYTLRKTYTHRLALALGVALSTVLLFVFMSFINKDKNTGDIFKNKGDVVKLTDINLAKPDDPEPIKPKPEIKPPQAQVDYQQFKIVKDPDVDEELVDIKDIANANIGNQTIPGDTPDGLAKLVTEPEGNGNVLKKEPETNNEPLISRPPNFPGGTQAWLSFLQRYLQSPEDLEPGQRIEVLVRFLIDVDGKVSNPEIIKSGGSSFDKEVLRVMKKMPRWEPAMQNGNFIAVPYTQPVIFLGVEQ